MVEYSLALSDLELLRYRFMARQAQEVEADLWRSAGIVAGAHVYDIGCGPGAVLVTMAQIAGAAGSVTGVDADEQALAYARGLIATDSVQGIALVAGQADDTGLEPGSADVVVMRHVLAHNGGSEQRIVDHLASLARPGGSVYLVDTFLDALRVTPEIPEFRELNEAYLAWHRRQGNDVNVGLRLSRLLLASGLDIVDYRGWFTILDVPVGFRPPAWAAIDILTDAGLASTEDRARWLQAMEAADAQDNRPSMVVPVFAAIGRKPPE